MGRVRNVGTAAVIASCAGGPALATMIGIGSLLSGDPVHVAPGMVFNVLAMISTVTVIGQLVAIIPNLLGSLVLGWLGRYNVGMRFPPVWGIVGATAGGFPAWLCSGPFDTWRTPAAMAGIGAVSTLVCRAKIYWEDEAAGVLTASTNLTPTRPQATP